MNPSTSCTTPPLAPAEGPWLARLLRRAARNGGRYLSALWNLRLGRPATEGRRLQLSEMSAHMLRDINAPHRFDLRRELDRYEQTRAGLPLSHF
ncbi:MAG: hypothetical protein Q7K57_55415 [Burkholderiaceae bacterium]|nr:hypothetical protein [Burkholderiaceae bacterium]